MTTLTTDKTTTTTITAEQVKKISHLARLKVNEQDISKHVTNLSNILDMIAQIDAVDTSHISPMSSSLETTTLALRADEITETNQRAVVQKLAPLVDSGLYLVPQVIE